MPRKRSSRLRFPGDIELTREQKLRMLADALSDPTDVSTDEELEKALKLQEGEVAELKADPAFYDPICASFMEKVNGNLAVDMIRELVRIVKRRERGTLNAAKLILQVSGRLGIPGITVNMNNAPTPADEARKLSPAELDREINRMLLAVNPHDVAFSDDGKVVEAQYELIEEITSFASDPAVEAARTAPSGNGEDPERTDASGPKA